MKMPPTQERTAALEERIAFYREHHALLETCLPRIGKDFGPEGRQLVEAARQRLHYAPSTGSRDILGILLRGWRKWRQRGVDHGPSHGPDPASPQ